MSLLIDQNLAVVDQGLALLEALRHAGARGPNLRVGPHFRHCIDFYDCFLEGSRSGRIDYDARTRSSAVETDLATAERALRGIREGLCAIEPTALGQAVETRADAIADESPWTTSTVGRELLFLLSHTIHHYALIGLLLREDGFDVPPELGMAPSTLQHLERQPECAR